jgi:hypothetical protein
LLSRPAASSSMLGLEDIARDEWETDSSNESLPTTRWSDGLAANVQIKTNTTAERSKVSSMVYNIKAAIWTRRLDAGDAMGARKQMPVAICTTDRGVEHSATAPE